MLICLVCNQTLKNSQKFKDLKNILFSIYTFSLNIIKFLKLIVGGLNIIYATKKQVFFITFVFFCYRYWSIVINITQEQNILCFRMFTKLDFLSYYEVILFLSLNTSLDKKKINLPLYYYQTCYLFMISF